MTTSRDCRDVSAGQAVLAAAQSLKMNGARVAVMLDKAAGRDKYRILATFWRQLFVDVRRPSGGGTLEKCPGHAAFLTLQMRLGAVQIYFNIVIL